MVQICVGKQTNIGPGNGSILIVIYVFPPQKCIQNCRTEVGGHFYSASIYSLNVWGIQKLHAMLLQYPFIGIPVEPLSLSVIVVNMKNRYVILPT